MAADDAGLEFENEVPERPPVRAAPASRGKPASAATRTRRPARSGGRRKGRAAPPREKPKVTVSVVGLDRSFEAEVGTDLRKACRDNHVNLFWGPWAQAFNCRGVATCGLCKIEVVQGSEHLTPRTKKEQKRLRAKPDHWRLACHAQLEGHVRIDPFPRVPIDQQVGEEAIRRALMTEEEREQLRENRRVERQAERARPKGTAPEAGEKKGLLARFQKKRGGEEDPASDKSAKKLPRRKSKAAKTKGGDEGAKDAAEDPSASGDADAKPAAKAGKRSFGLKGRKS